MALYDDEEVRAVEEDDLDEPETCWCCEAATATTTLESNGQPVCGPCAGERHHRTAPEGGREKA